MFRPVDRRGRIIRLLLAVDLVLLCGAVFLSGPGRRVVAWEATRRLTRALGPAASYDVQVYASWWQLLWGEVPLMQVRARDLRMKDGLRVATVDARIEGVTLRGNVITALSAVHFNAEVSEAALNDYLPVRPQRMRFEPSLRLSLLDGQVRVALMLPGPFGFSLPTSLEVVGKLRASDPQHLRFTVDDGSLGIGYLPAWLRDHGITVLDLASSPFGLHVDALRVLPGRVQVEGTSAPPLPLVLRKLEEIPTPLPQESR